MPNNKVVLSSVTLSEQVYDCLLSRIASGEYMPGQPLREVELSKELGVSRTPVREAILRLIEYGLVQGEGRLAHVRRMTPDDVTHLYQVRRALEVLAVRLACGRLTADDFDRLEAADPGDDESAAGYAVACRQYDQMLHRTIAERSGNPLLAFKLRKLHDRVHLVCRATGPRVGEHRAIVAALKAGDRRGAVRAMSAHLSSALRTQCRNAQAAEQAGTGA